MLDTNQNLIVYFSPYQKFIVECFIFLLANSRPVVDETILNLESVISRVHDHFTRSNTQLFKLKQWQSYLDLSEDEIQKSYFKFDGRLYKIILDRLL